MGLPSAFLLKFGGFSGSRVTFLEGNIHGLPRAPLMTSQVNCWRVEKKSGGFQSRSGRISEHRKATLSPARVFPMPYGQV